MHDQNESSAEGQADKDKELGLFEAIFNGDALALRKALLRGCDPAIPHPRLGSTPLASAVLHNSPECIAELLSEDLPAQPPQKDIDVALMLAARGGFAECVRALLPRANPRAQNISGNTALMFAAADGRTDCAQALCDVSDLRQTNTLGQTALMIASSRKFEECAKILLPGSDPDQIDLHLQTALHIALANGHERCAALLVASTNPDAVDILGHTPLLSAAYRGSLECVCLLLPLSKNTPDSNGNSPAQLASERGHHETARLIEDYFYAQQEKCALNQHASAACVRANKSKL